MENSIDFTHINNDTYGNPRYVIHYSNLLTEKDKDVPFEQRYSLAIQRSRKWFGRKFHNKQYGGGIVFQTYNTGELERKIIEFLQTI